MHSGERWRLGHRPALDGLRGVAVLLVVAAHTSVPGLFAAGAVGVTMFFTLSGFLITSLLVEEHAARGMIDLRRFYLRRFRRLGPALLVFVAFIAAVGTTARAAAFFEWRDALAVLFYGANWIKATGGELGAFSGMWSLAIEEQFYLLWPLVVLWAARRGWVGRAGLAVIVASLTARGLLYLDGAPAARVYAGTDTTAISLAAGALLAVHFQQRTSDRAHPLGVAGAVLVAISCLVPDSTLLWYAVVPIASLATVGLLWSASTSAPRLMTGRVLCWFGSRSYSLYLWHIPLARVLRERTDLPWWWQVVIVVPFGCLMAEGSYRLIEQRFRLGARSSQRSHEVVIGGIHRDPVPDHLRTA